MADTLETKEEDEFASLGGGPNDMNRDQSVPVKITRDRNTPIDIYPWFEITVQGIDVTSQTWNASVEIHLFWQDLGLPAQCPGYENGIYFDDLDSNSPIKLSEIFENKVGESVQSITFKYLPETSTIYMLVVVQVTFVERMELHRFPMDRQFLGMDFNAWTGIDPTGRRCRWNWITNPPDWVTNDDFRRPFAVRMLSSITEYEMLSPWVDFTGEQPLSIRLRVERQPGFYFASIILPNFLIITAAFAAFPIAIDDGDPQFIADRLSISVTLMLTAVAFRYVITDQLPMVTYLTVMDYYLLEGFIMLTLLIFENALVGITSWEAIQDQTKRENIDNWIAYLFVVLWGVTHVFWLVVLWNKNFMRVSWEKMDEIDSKEEDEFSYAPGNKSIGRPQSKDVLDEWNKSKGVSPKLRARQYSVQHPEVLKSDNES